MSTHSDWLKTIILPMPAALGTVNVYVVRTEHGVALIDTGLLDASSSQILEDELAGEGLTFDDIDQVLLTHHHVDHSGLAARLQTHGAKIYMSGADAASLHAFHCRPELDDARATCFSAHRVPEAILTMVRYGFSYMRRIGEDVTPDRLVRDGESIVLAGICFDVVATPGHTPGHIVLYQGDTGAVFSGDALLSANAIHLSGQDEGDDPYGQFLDSLERIMVLPRATAYPGHGRPAPDVANRASALKKVLNDDMRAVERRLTDSPRSAFELMSAVASDLRDRTFPKWLAFTRTVAFLTYLVKEGRARGVETAEGIQYRRP